MSRRRQSQIVEDQQASERVAALGFTADVVSGYLDGSDKQRDALVTRFPPSIAPDERIVCFGHFSRSWFGAIGNGSYNSMMALGTGALGAGMMIGAVASNSRAKRNAAAAAQQMWRQFDYGNIYVSDYGFYLDTGGGLASFGWEPIAECDLVSPGIVQFGANLAGGTYERFRLESHYAELIMLTWAIVRHPQHPYLAHYLSQLSHQQSIPYNQNQLPPPPRQPPPP